MRASPLPLRRWDGKGLAMRTAFDGQDVAQSECSSGRHASQRATDMLGGVGIEDKPRFAADGGKVLVEAAAQGVVHWR